MKALCLVAHPDDCVIFAYPYIYHHIHYAWTIAYLTHESKDDRAREMSQFWQRRGIDTVFLGFEDHYDDDQQKKFTRWLPESAVLACRDLAGQYDLVLTHDANGDYGHIHHKLVHEAVTNHLGLVTFSPPGQGTKYILPQDAYSIDELPVHAHVIQAFHFGQHVNYYKEQQ